MSNKSKSLSVIAIILAAVGLVFLMLSIFLHEERSLFLSLGLPCVALSNFLTTIWAKKKDNSDENK
ncbi:MAG: hypothetical protein MJ176_08515 [Treponema sp.]|nr:hypothetical protein [Treponema sp.]